MLDAEEKEDRKSKREGTFSSSELPQIVARSPDKTPKSRRNDQISKIDPLASAASAESRYLTDELGGSLKKLEQEKVIVWESGDGISFNELGQETEEDLLRLYHTQEGFKCRLGRKDRAHEIFEKIREEKERRDSVCTRTDKLLKDVAYLTSSANSDPAVRDELRKIVLNPNFQEARFALREAKDIMAPLFEIKVNSGVFVRGGLGVCELENKPPEKDGPSVEPGAYDAHTLRITAGMAQGNFATIKKYEAGENAECETSLCL